MASYIELKEHREEYLGLFDPRSAPIPSNYELGSSLRVKHVVYGSQAAPQSKPLLRQVTVKELFENTSISPDSVNLVFCDNERPSFWPQAHLHDFEFMFRKLGIPSCFILEKVLSQTHSFGTRETNDAYDYWYRFLNKNINFRTSKEGSPIGFPLGSTENPASDMTWNQASFYMRHTKSDNKTTLVCFNVDGENRELRERLLKFMDQEDNRASVRSDPYVLLLPILHHFFESITLLHYTVLDLFKNGAEKAIFRYAATRKAHNVHELDFAYLHNIATHVIHLMEGMDSIIDAMALITAEHKQYISDNPNTGSNPRYVMLEAARGFHYQEGLLNGLRIRLKSLDRRVTNAIALAFHLATEMDTVYQQKENASMSVIAIVTLIFLPATTVMSFFGSQLISFEPERLHEKSGGLSWSPKMWLYAAISIPITVMTISSWYLATKSGHRDIKHRLFQRTMISKTYTQNNI